MHIVRIIFISENVFLVWNYLELYRSVISVKGRSGMPVKRARVTESKFVSQLCCSQWQWLMFAGSNPIHRLQMKQQCWGPPSPTPDHRAVCVYSTCVSGCSTQRSHILYVWLTCSSWLRHSLIPLLSQMDSVFLSLSGVTVRSSMFYTQTFMPPPHTHTM